MASARISADSGDRDPLSRKEKNFMKSHGQDDLSECVIWEKFSLKPEVAPTRENFFNGIRRLECGIGPPCCGGIDPLCSDSTRLICLKYSLNSIGRLRHL